VSIDVDLLKQFSVSKRNVLLTEKNKGTSERRTTTNENGEFCFEVKPGQYTITPLVSAEEKEKGLKLLPTEKSVTVAGDPILNVNFN
jgi:hypothetical protein